MSGCFGNPDSNQSQDVNKGTGQGETKQIITNHYDKKANHINQNIDNGNKKQIDANDSSNKRNWFSNYCSCNQEHLSTINEQEEHKSSRDQEEVHKSTINKQEEDKSSRDQEEVHKSTINKSEIYKSRISEQEENKDQEPAQDETELYKYPQAIVRNSRTSTIQLLSIIDLGVSTNQIGSQSNSIHSSENTLSEQSVHSFTDKKVYPQIKEWVKSLFQINQYPQDQQGVIFNTNSQKDYEDKIITIKFNVNDKQYQLYATNVREAQNATNQKMQRKGFNDLKEELSKSNQINDIKTTEIDDGQILYFYYRIQTGIIQG